MNQFFKQYPAMKDCVSAPFSSRISQHTYFSKRADKDCLKKTNAQRCCFSNNVGVWGTPHHIQIYICAVWDCVKFSSLESYLEWINVSAFSASVNQESVKASISARNCNQASLLAGPSRPETQGNIVQVGRAPQIPAKFSKFTLTKWWGHVCFQNACTNMSVPSHKHAHNEGTYMCKVISTQKISTGQLCLPGITSNVIFVGGVNFFYSSVAEGQLSHPVHASPYACGQTQVGTGSCCMETISAEVIRAKIRAEKECVSTSLFHCSWRPSI